MMASCYSATEIFDLPAGTKWDKLHDDACYEWKVVVDPSQSITGDRTPDQAADYTIHSSGLLVDTITMATQNAKATDRTQIIDFPEGAGDGWARLWVQPNGHQSYCEEHIPAPYDGDLAALLKAGVTGAQLREAAHSLQQNDGIGHARSAKVASMFFDRDVRPQVIDTIVTMLGWSQDGYTGVAYAMRDAAIHQDAASNV